MAFAAVALSNLLFSGSPVCQPRSSACQWIACRSRCQVAACQQWNEVDSKHKPLELGTLPERVFFVPFRRIPADPLPALSHWGSDGLSQWERFDVLCRCIVASLVTSHGVRRRTRFVAVFTKPSWKLEAPRGNVDEYLHASLQGQRVQNTPLHTTLQVLGDEVDKMPPNERWMGVTFRKALQRFFQPNLKQSARTRGWKLQRSESVAAMLDEILCAGCNTTQHAWLLFVTEDAPRSAYDELKAAHLHGVSRIVMVLGDQVGMGQEEQKMLQERFDVRPVTLGSTSLLTSQCIVVLHHLIEQAWS